MQSVKHKLGDSVLWNVTYTDSQLLPINITGFNIEVYATDERNTQIFYLINNDGVNILDPLNGVFEIYIKDTDTLPIGKLFISIRYTDSNGYKKSSESFVLQISKRL